MANTTTPLPTRAELLKVARPSPCFKPELRKAILERRKTQTRRIVMDSERDGQGKLIRWAYLASVTNWRDHRCLQSYSFDPRTARLHIGASTIKAPHGKPGDVWYLREPIRRCGLAGVALYADDDRGVNTTEGGLVPWRWQRSSLPQIHLPRVLARHFCRVTDVRLEQAQAISRADALAEGVLPPDQWTMQREAADANSPLHHDYARSAKDNFPHLWDSINGKNYPWASNPWVWVYSFELMEVA